MKNILLVPIRLDALHLAADDLVLQATADFSRLPYTDGARDVNADTLNLSAEIVAAEFQDKNLHLKAGIHLHWALPDALTKGVQGKEGVIFPAVPNRWVVLRGGKGTGGAAAAPEKRWVVESDYLYPDGSGALVGSVNIPHEPGVAGQRPFRYLGRTMPLAAWREEGAGAERFKLTAVGYGEPSFAAFYPNCHSVFGLHDDDYTDDIPEGLQYDVIGWYADPATDRLKTFIDEFKEKERREERGEPSAERITGEFKSGLGWVFKLGKGEELPVRTLCYARLVFKHGAKGGPHAPERRPVIAVANTGTEALSAYLAHAVGASRKSELEDQLEALLLATHIENRKLDVGPKFQEARHEKGFTSVAGGTLWAVTAEGPTSSPTDGERAQITLDPKLARVLNELNAAQRAYDRALQSVESMRRQLFSDWCKYMLCAYPARDERDPYPNVDEVRNYIELKGLAPLREREGATGKLEIKLDAGGNTKRADAGDSSPHSAAARVAGFVNELLLALDAHNRKDPGPPFRLRQIPGPRYYQPNDPVVLMTGTAVKPSERHGQDGRLRDDGLLECQFFQSAETSALVPDQLPQLAARLDQLHAAAGDKSIAYNNWEEQPWHPFLLEWEAEFFPVESGSNLNPETGRYLPTYITDNYVLAENRVDFTVREGKGYVARAASVYSGRSILTPHAGEQLKEHLEAYLRDQMLDSYLSDQKLPTPAKPPAYFREHRAAILAWYRQNKRGGGDDTAPVYQIARAYEHLDAPDFYSLSQSLGGFNQALLMRRQTMQLDVDDPLGFEDYKPFTADVRAAVGDGNVSAPQPLNDFLPVRAGTLKLLRLRLVDTFGRTRDLDCEEIITTEKLKVAGSPYPVTLPPRLTQPARLNFRWLAADSGEQEMNDHPATTPVCGWVLPNYLDRSLLIYDKDGKALGAVDEEAGWQRAPGGEGVADIVNAPPEKVNPHLKKMVGYLLARKDTFRGHFLDALGNALENIEPENFAQHQDLALLMGRPLALVRASINLELQGPPAVHQSWNSFRHDMRRHRRDDSGFSHVRFPVRIGEYRQMNDGLAGYWREEGDGYERDTFYAPQSEAVKDDLIKTHADTTAADDPLTIRQAVAAPPHVLAMLVDPRGTVHAASGLVPVKGINLPPDQYADALAAIEVTFLCTPFLTDARFVSLPLPREPSSRWSLLRKDGDSWAEISTTGTIKKQRLLEAFRKDGEALWGVLQEKGWLVETDAATASVTPADLRKSRTLGEPWTALQPAVELLLAGSYIGQPSESAAFSNTQTILEGWLKLRRDAKPPTREGA